MHPRIINLLVAWRETGRADSSCVDYADTCVEYLTEHDQIEQTFKPQTKGAHQH